MLDALVSGTTDPVVLADLARGLLRKKIPALREALEGRFDTEHALIVSQILAHIDFLDEAIDRLSDEIEQRIAPFAAQRDLLMSIPGVKQRTAEVLIAEIGVDMSVFPTPKHLASWAKMCPGNDESAGKRRSGKTGKGNKWLRANPDRSRARRQPDQGLLPRRPVPAPPRPPRPLQGRHRRRALDPDRRLAHAPNRRALQRPRQRLLHPPKPRPRHQTPRPTARSARTHTSRSNPERSPPDGDFATGGTALIDAQASSASARGTSAANATRMKASRLTTPMACAHGASATLSSPMPTISSATASRAPSVGPSSSWATPL